MKKLLSLLVATVLVTSLFTTAFAATPNVSATLTETEVNIGETFTLTISSAEKTVYIDDVRLKYEMDKFETVSKKGVVGGQEYDGVFGITEKGVFANTPVQMNFNTLENNAGYSWTIGTSGVAKTYLASTVAVIEFKALEAGEFTFTLEEHTNYTGASDHTGFDGVAGTYTVTVVDPNAGPDEAIEVGATSTDDPEAGTRTWAVEVGADLIANGKIKAVLTNSHADVASDNTQEVALSFGTVDKDSEMDCQFNVVVKFQDYAKYAATTNLDIVKAN